MSETRYDWLADRWVIFAPNRSQRPDEFRHVHRSSSSEVECPFCLGNEQLTPESLLVLPRRSKASTSPQLPTGRFASQRSNRTWQVRVIPNKFPALAPISLSGLSDLDVGHLSENHNDSKRPVLPMLDPLQSSYQLSGVHEVIVETPKHLNSLTQLSPTQCKLVFEAYRQRLNHWRAHDALRYGVVFKNVGSDAGASLSHSHSQLIATTFVPPEVFRCCQRLMQYRESYGKDFFEDTIEKETIAQKRIVYRSERLIAIAPFASHVPYLVQVLPIKDEPRFEETSSQTLGELAMLARQMLAAIEKMFPSAAYNFVIHTSPFDPNWDQSFRWRLEIFPRLTKVAGFEWGSDCFINPVIPEEAAARMREQLNLSTLLAN
jgi:UDPglucose--hexose-1-phosphate uridylyltransferase